MGSRHRETHMVRGVAGGGDGLQPVAVALDGAAIAEDLVGREGGISSRIEPAAALRAAG
jgi:hypothetical protein